MTECNRRGTTFTNDILAHSPFSVRNILVPEGTGLLRLKHMRGHSGTARRCLLKFFLETRRTFKALQAAWRRWRQERQDFRQQYCTRPDVHGHSALKDGTEALPDEPSPQSAR